MDPLHGRQGQIGLLALLINPAQIVKDYLVPRPGLYHAFKNTKSSKIPAASTVPLISYRCYPILSIIILPAKFTRSIFRNRFRRSINYFRKIRRFFHHSIIWKNVLFIIIWTITFIINFFLASRLFNLDFIYRTSRWQNSKNHKHADWNTYYFFIHFIPQFAK